VLVLAALAMRGDLLHFAVYPYLPFFLKVLLGAGFGKNCPQITSSTRVRGKLREIHGLGAVVN
jgi:hypothetical protein